MAGKIALDSGALIALSRGNENARAVLERWTRAGFETVLPCPVLAETLRGRPSDAAVHRIVNSRFAAITVLPVFEYAARDAGARIGQTTRKHVTVDAMIVAVAVEHGAREIVTCDRDRGSLRGRPIDHRNLRVPAAPMLRRFALRRA